MGFGLIVGGGGRGRGSSAEVGGGTGRSPFFEAGAVVVGNEGAELLGVGASGIWPCWLG